MEKVPSNGEKKEIENYNLSIFNSSKVDELNNDLDKFSKKTKELLKSSLISMFEKGYNVGDKKIYNSMKELLSKLEIFELCDFEDIDETLPKSLKEEKFKFIMGIDKKNNKMVLFANDNGTGFSSQFGYISNGKFIKKYQILNFDNGFNNNEFEYNNLNELIKNDLEKYNKKLLKILPKKDIVKKQPINPEIKEELPEISEHIVKSGDTIWAIIKKYYKLKSNRDIANVINKIVKYNIENGNAGKLGSDSNGDRIKGDKIYPNQKILLPKEVKFRKTIFIRKK